MASVDGKPIGLLLAITQTATNTGRSKRMKSRIYTKKIKFVTNTQN